MLTLTFVRHGESVDNVRNIWAGWKDSELSVHGFNQAKAVGEFFSANAKIDYIFASPLQRAKITAMQIYDCQPDPKPSITLSPLLREQYWGVAEGHPFIFPSNKIKEGRHYKPLFGRSSRFPEGESLEDVATRAGEFIDEYLAPLVLSSMGKSVGEVMVFIVAHGIVISEMIGAIIRHDTSEGAPPSKTWRGLHNTGWTRLEIGSENERSPVSSSSVTPTTADSRTDTGAVFAAGAQSADPPPEMKEHNPNLSSEEARRLHLTVRITRVNQLSHLANVTRQPGGIGSSAHDPKQASIKDFFLGGGITKGAATRDI